MQLVHTSLVTAIRHWCAPSLIHTLPTEQYNQDIVSLGTHSALTALDVVGLLRNAVAITLLSTAQAIDLRQGGGLLGAGTRPIYGPSAASAGSWKRTARSTATSARWSS